MDEAATGWPPKNAFEAAGDGEPSLDAGLPSLDAGLPSPGSDDDDAAPPPAWMVPAAAAPASSDPLRDEEYWARPEIKVKIERMRELGEKAKLHATSRREKRLLAQYYTEEGLRRRVLLLSHPKVVRALETIWKATDTDRSGAIDREEYLVMHRKLVLALDPTTSPKTAFEAAAEDWVKDADGKRFMDKERFYWCWFELADLWTDSLDPKAYVDFLIGTMQIVTRNESWGIDWASDNQVIAGHFKMRRSAGQAEHESMLENAMIEFDVNESYPMVLSLWHEELRKDVIVRA